MQCCKLFTTLIYVSIDLQLCSSHLEDPVNILRILETSDRYPSSRATRLFEAFIDSSNVLRVLVMTCVETAFTLPENPKRLPSHRRLELYSSHICRVSTSVLHRRILTLCVDGLVRLDHLLLVH